MSFINRFGLAIVALALSACSSNMSSLNDSADSADLVLSNAKIYTVDQEQPWAEAIAIKHGKIVFVGSNENARSWVGKSTQQQDLKGKLVLPGFIDSHAHPVSGGAYVRSLSLDTYSDPEGWLKQVAEYAAANPQTPILFGYGFLASAFGAEGPTAAQLDRIVADRPVFLMDEGFHGAWANTQAMDFLKIDKNTPDLVAGFSYYKRDSKGNPTGYFLEGTASDAMDKLGVINLKNVTRGTADIFGIMNSYGITAVFDAGAQDVDEMQVKALDKLYEQGEFTVRMSASHAVASVDKIDTAITKTMEKKQTTKRPMYHINTLKIMNDGTIEGRTAGMFEDYQKEPGNKGSTVFSQEQINRLVTQATSENIDVHIHALGDRAISESLTAIELAKGAYPEKNVRYTICHVQVIRNEDIQRFADLEVIVQSTPLWASYDNFGKKFVNEDQFNRYFRFNSLKQAGVKMAFGSDYPASGAGILGMSPLYNIEIGHTRQAQGEPNAKVQPRKGERLDLATLIKGYTLDGAYQLRMEDKIGSIKVGKLADLVVLESNLFEVSPYDIAKIKVEQTFLGGQVVYKK